jgi:hypothetical protein
MSWARLARDKAMWLATALVVAGVLFASLPKAWIEDTLGFEPDGGSGALELVLVVSLVGAGIAIALPRLRKAGRTARSAPGLR